MRICNVKPLDAFAGPFNRMDVSSLTVSDIVGALPHGTFSYEEQHCRRNLEEAVASLPLDYVRILSGLVLANSHRKSSDNALLLSDPSFYHFDRPVPEPTRPEQYNDAFEHCVQNAIEQG